MAGSTCDDLDHCARRHQSAQKVDSKIAKLTFVAPLAVAAFTIHGCDTPTDT
jgi:hypothetical protein